MATESRIEFQFHDCLGKGGFGEVYLATVKKAGLTRQMAVKVLKEGLDDQDDAVMRLRDEGRILGMLNHPAILGATDMCRIQGRIALVMEYVEGMDLTKACRPDRLMPQKCVLQAMGEIADALHAAWSTVSPETGNPLRLIHRDVKPENMRLTIHGQVKLLDFGIARSQEMSRQAKTKLGELPFTPGYAAPECFRRGEQGAESDVYALGSSMYRLLVGERLFEDMDVGEQFATAAMDDVYNPWVIERLAKVHAEDPRTMALLHRMLSYEKADRPTAKDVADRCEEIAGDMVGPTLQKWVRGIQFPAIKPIKDAALAGKTLFEDPPQAQKSPGRGGTAPPSRQKAEATMNLATPSPAPHRPGPLPAKPPEFPASNIPKGRSITPISSPVAAAPTPKPATPRKSASPSLPPQPASSSASMAFAGVGLLVVLGLGVLLVVVGVVLIALVVYG